MLLEQAGRHRVQVTGHETGRMINDHDLDARLAHGACGLQTKQATAQHDGAPGARAARNQPLGIAEIAEGEDTRQE